MAVPLQHISYTAQPCGMLHELALRDLDIDILNVSDSSGLMHY